ncbi:MAG: hypothetical protein IJU56_01080 [Clostridia bacterium]|nr:hypothetical protein [Clostridia bacterium]
MCAFRPFARSFAARTRRRDEPCGARFKNEAALRFSRGNLPRDPAAGLRTAKAVRKSAPKGEGGIAQRTQMENAHADLRDDG